MATTVPERNITYLPSGKEILTYLREKKTDGLLIVMDGDRPVLIFPDSVEQNGNIFEGQVRVDHPFTKVLNLEFSLVHDICVLY